MNWIELKYRTRSNFRLNSRLKVCDVCIFPGHKLKIFFSKTLIMCTYWFSLKQTNQQKTKHDIWFKITFLTEEGLAIQSFLIPPISYHYTCVVCCTHMVEWKLNSGITTWLQLYLISTFYMSGTSLTTEDQWDNSEDQLKVCEDK